MKHFDRIEEYFSHIAKNNPDHIAVKEGENSVTYDKLDTLSTSFAYYLIDQGVLPGDFIPIIANKSFLVIIAILGILKAGAAYVPIASDFPLETVVSILKKVDARCICIDDSFSQQKLNLTSKHIVLPLSSVLNETKIGDIPQEKMIVSKKMAYAYMVFTSGSTGFPNGVLVSHDNLIATFTSWLHAYELTPEDCHLQMANISFDVFAGDWLRALFSGGTLVLCDKNTLLSPQKLYSIIVKENITVAEFVPAILRILMKYCNIKKYRLSSFRLLICGSDSWTMAEYRQVKALCEKTARVVSSYGLTETTIDSTYFEEENSQLSDEALVPLGKPFPHVFTRIVNEFFETVVSGKSGELLIGGKGVAKGYFHNPTLQSERFIHDLDENNGIMFRTGDCVKMLVDGNIYFEGRNIHCINISGVRIDINSVEAVLKNHPKISQALVTVNNKLGQFYLMYYLILEDESLTYEELISYLNTKFKKVILPSNFYIVKSLGLTFNNKINRKFVPDKILRILSPAMAQSVA